jgi:hypothetical protein
MVDKIKAQLKAKLQTLGVKNLSQARIDAIADKLSSKITEESQIDEKLDELNELHPFADIAKYDDWQRTQASKQRQQQQQGGQQPNGGQQQHSSNDDDPMKVLLAQMQQLTEKVSSFEKEKTQSQLQKRLQEKMAEKKIPSILLKGRQVESEDQLDQVLSEIEADHTAYKQELVNQGFSQTSAPVGGVSTIKSESIDQDIKAWAGKDKK